VKVEASSRAPEVAAKVERDVRVTFGATDFLTRKISKDGVKIFSSVRRVRRLAIRFFASLYYGSY